MNWFEDQISERRKSDQLALEDSFQRIAGVVLGQRMAEKLSDDQIITKASIDEILKYYHYKPVEIPESIQEAEEQLDYCLRHYGMMKRGIELTDDWYKNAYGPILGFFKESGSLVALLPDKVYGYYYRDSVSGMRVRVNKKVASEIDTDALCFYVPLPMKKLGIPDLLIYMQRCINVYNVVSLIIAAFAVSAVGLLIPIISAAITGPVVSSGNLNALIGAAICIFCVSLSMNLVEIIKGIVSSRITTKTSVGVESSMMMRIISLPVSFFRDYSAGELMTRANAVNSLCAMLQTTILNTGLTSLMSLIYITQIVSFAPALVVPSIIIILITVGFSLVTTIIQMRITRRRLEISAKESGMSLSIINGIQKIKLAGAEKRIFAKWLNLYAKQAECTYNPPLIIKVSSAISLGITLFSSIVLYYLSVKSGMDQSSYFAFTAAYGCVMVAFSSLSSIAVTFAQIQPILAMAKPFLEAVPEMSEHREIVTNITGKVALDHVSFRYSKDTPYILNDLSLTINSGEYVAIVGRTGCGKSTLIRLLLGFEVPEKGAVYYDNKDISSLDLGSLRKNIGTVTQDGGLFQGDIYSNIVITDPSLTLDDAWEAAEIAGIANDIKDMPMEMMTLISEGQGGISGGQKQRIMIARAVAPKPKLLIFDEATSALDNTTQKQVSESLDKMGCTRIVVAHRLSTIRHCDRILVLDGGEIIEDGTYEELIDANGYFAELVERQRLDVK